MKVSQLKETIRAKVRETLYAGPNALPAAIKDPAYNALPPTEKIKVNNALKQKQSVNLEENGEYTMDRIWKMNRNELIDFLGLTREEAINWSDRQLQGAALEMADDKPADEEIVDEADYIDDDDVIHEDVEDIDDKDPTFKDYNSIYETEISGEFEANVGSGHLGISVKPHPMDQRLIVISQDNGQKVVVSVEDVYELINTLKGLA